MDQTLIFWPMIAHVALVMIVYFELGRRRFKAGKAGKIQYDNYKVMGRSLEPDDCATASRNVVNNFELPVLFHAVILALYLTNLAFLPQLMLAWLFVGTRYVHSFVHLTYNHVMHRAFCFFAGVFVLIVMWALFAVNLYSGSF